MRIGAVLFLLVLPVQGKDLFRCENVVSFGHENWELIAADKSDFGATQLKRFTGFDGIDAITTFSAMPLAEDGRAFNVIAGFEVQRGRSVRRFRLVDTGKAVPRVVNETPGGDPVPQPPPRVALAAGPDVPVVRVDFREHIVGMRAESNIAWTALFDFRPKAPRFATIGCNSPAWGEDPDALRESARCRWSDEHADFVCESSRVMKTDRGVLRARGRRELLSNERLHVPERRALLFAANGVRFVATPSAIHMMSMRLFAEHPGGRVERVPVDVVSTTGVVDGSGIAPYRDVAKEGFSLVTSGGAFRSRRIRRDPDIYAVVLTEGTRRALFWIAVDGKTFRGLRVASTSAEAGDQRAFVRPPAITSAAWREGEAAADVIVEPGFVARGILDVQRSPEDDCAVPATLRWSSEGTFVLTPRAACPRPGRQVEIDERGGLRSVPREVRIDALLTTGSRASF